MDQIGIEEIKQRASSGILFLTFRNIGIQAVSTLGFFLLTFLLGTGEVGLFAIVAESIGILGYFSDVGLASALIQKKDSVTDTELRTTFTIQQILVVISLVITFLIYGHFSELKHFGSKENWIMISLCFSFFVASLKTIPSVLLERKLNFKILSTVDIAENITFYVIAVLLAFMGVGAYSYAVAAFIRSLVGLIIIYSYQSWPIGISFSFSTTKNLFKYGIPFQLNSFIAVAKDRLSSLLVAGIIGRDGFGILSWAQKCTRTPLSLMDSMIRVTFPAFSRLQNNPEMLKLTIEKSVYYVAFFIFPSLAGISLVAPDFIQLIPKYHKWDPAILPLYLLSINACIASVTTPLTNAFNAIGKITLTTKLMIMWTVLTWIFYPILSLKYGFLGTSIAALIVGSSSFIVWHLSDTIFQTKIFILIAKPIISTLIMILILTLINYLPFTIGLIIIIKILIGISVYAIFHLLFSRQELQWLKRQIQSLLVKKLA